MNLLAKILSRVPLIGRLVRNYYEGSIWRSGERTYLPQGIQDARIDASAMTRLELLRKARYFESNNGIFNNLADKWEQYTVGDNGLVAVSSSPDANEYFKRWCCDCDALGLMDFGTIQSVAARGWFVDGDSFVVRTVVKGRLKIQLIEAHRCETPSQMAKEEGVSIIDGKQVDGHGRVIGFWFRVGPTVADSRVEQGYKFVPAEDVHHVYEPCRAAMYRGLSACYPVINDLHDLDDLQMLTMQVAKQAATIGNVTNNRTGELDTKSARRSLLSINSTNSAGTATTKSTGEFYNVKLGASEIALQHGDSISQFQANRPSLVEQQHWDYLTSKICVGVGISRQLIMPYSIQGTVARADLDVCAAFFRARSAVMQKMVARVFCWVIEWAQQFDREVLAGGFDFNGYDNVMVRPPRAPNVDVGRNSSALISEIENKIRTYQDEFSAQGYDWREQFRKIKEAQDYAKELGISLAEIEKPEAAAEPEKEETHATK